MMGSESRTNNWLFGTGLVSRGRGYNSVHWRAVASCSFRLRTYWVATAATISLNQGDRVKFSEIKVEIQERHTEWVL